MAGTLSIGGAIKAQLVAAQLPIALNGQAIYRDLAPKTTPLPFITFADELSDTPILKGDGGVLYRMGLSQVDLFQTQGQENLTLQNDILNALDGSTLPECQNKVVRVRVADVRRVPEDVYDVTHVSYTLHIWYQPL